MISELIRHRISQLAAKGRRKTRVERLEHDRLAGMLCRLMLEKNGRPPDPENLMPDPDEPGLEPGTARPAIVIAHNGHARHEPEPAPASALADLPDHYPTVVVPPRRVYGPGDVLPPHLPLAEVARACGVQHSAVWKDCCAYGLLPYSRVGTRLIVDMPDALAYIRRGWHPRRGQRPQPQPEPEVAAATARRRRRKPEPAPALPVPVQATPPPPPAPVAQPQILAPIEPRQPQLRFIGGSDTSPRLVGRGWLMEHLDIGEAEVDALFDSGVLPVFRLGGQRKVLLADLLHWLEGCRE